MRGVWIGVRGAVAAVAIAAVGGCSPHPWADEAMRADEREFRRAVLGTKVRPEDCGGKVVARVIVQGHWLVVRFVDGSVLTVRGVKYVPRINEMPQ